MVISDRLEPKMTLGLGNTTVITAEKISEDLISHVTISHLAPIGLYLHYSALACEVIKKTLR